MMAREQNPPGSFSIETNSSRLDFHRKEQVLYSVCLSDKLIFAMILESVNSVQIIDKMIQK